MPRAPQTPEEYGAVYDPDAEEPIEDYQEWEPVEENIVEDDITEAEEVEVQPKRKLGTGEPVLLYIEFSPHTYELFGQTFDSKIEASQYAEKEYPGSKYKVLTESEALKEAEKIERRHQQVQHAKEIVKGGAKAGIAGVAKVGKAVLESAYQEARKEGLTREQYEAKSRELQLKKQKKEIKQMDREPRQQQMFQPPQQPTQRSTFQPHRQPEQRQWGEPERRQPSEPRQQFRGPPKPKFVFHQPTGFYRPQMFGGSQQRGSTFDSTPHFRPHFVGERRRPPEQKPKPKKKKLKRRKK